MRRLSVAVICATVSGLASAQVNDEAGALRRAEAFLIAIGSAHRPATAHRMLRRPVDPVEWKVETRGEARRFESTNGPAR